MLKIFMLPMIVQALFIIHVIKTGRSTSWIYLLVFLPYAGGIAYLVVEFIPSMFNRRRVDRAAESIGDFWRPGGKIGRMEDLALYSPTFKNVSALGDAYLDLGRYADAARVYQGCLKPPFENNDVYLYKLAFAHYKTVEFEKADDVMEKISLIGLGKLKAQEILLRGKIFEGMERWDDAKKYYHDASLKSSDLSYRFEYGLYLKRTGDLQGSKVEFDEVSNLFRRLPRAFQRQYRDMMNNLQEETSFETI
jgi:hypothetical protein